ncbi:hypothetical protein QOZ80_1BG0071960 [Eleusine coracana subsp. coracana]|nr:hypothetical protein QOZ80_1BG0071960 [Eleusine coracana subsp. coracana]
MEKLRDWAGLPRDMLECISNRLDDPEDFISFRFVCSQWRMAIKRDGHALFHPWILKSDEVGVEGNVVFDCLNSEKVREIHVQALKGRKTRLVGFGAGHLIAVDWDDELSGVLVNPLTNESTTLPRLPEWLCGGCITGFATDPKMTGEDDVFVVIYRYRWWRDGEDNMVAIWRCGSGAGWATIPFRRFWPAMPRLRRRLAEHGPTALEDEAAAAADGGIHWPLDEQDAHVIEHQGKVCLLSRLEFVWYPPVSFTLQDMLRENLTLVDWDDAPELHGKIILQTWNLNPCYVLPARDGFTGLSGKNCIYFFSWQYHTETNKEEFCLFKWDFLERVSTVVKKMPYGWSRAHERWFLPNLKSSSGKGMLDLCPIYS